MLRLFARITRAGPLDDACLDAHPLFRHALLPDFSQQIEHHRASARHRNHAQREQALIKNANGSGQAQGRRSNALLGGRSQHQRAQQRMCQQQGVELLDHPLRRQRAQGACRQAQHGPGFSDHQFGMPALMKEHGQLLGRIQERVQQRGHQSIDLLARPRNTRIGEGVADDAHQHRLSRVVVLIPVDVRQIAAIGQRDERGEQHVLLQASQHLPTSRAHRKDGPTGMKAAIPQQQALHHPPAFQEQPQTAGFSLAAGTQFGITDQMRPTFHQQHQAGLWKGTLRLGVIGAVAEGLAIAWRVRHRLDRPINGKQAQPAPERSRGCLRWLWVRHTAQRGPPTARCPVAPDDS